MKYVVPVDFGAFPPTAFHSQRLADRSGGLDSCLCICTRVPPGTGTTSGRHTHAGDQFYFVLTGTMHAEIAGQTFEVQPNTLVFIPAGTPHWNWNEGAEDEVHFELIVPSPEPGQPVASPIAGDPPASSRTLPELIRPLAAQAPLDPTRASQVILANHASGVTSGVGIGYFQVPPGTSPGPGLHVHRFDQIYYVIQGTMQLQIGLESYTAGPNTLVVLPAGMPHRNWNDGPDMECHLNLRVPEPLTHESAWDVPVQFLQTPAAT